MIERSPGQVPARMSGECFFLQGQLSMLLFRYPFHLRVTRVARKRFWSFCQKCSWQVTAKHACTLRMWLCMKWRGIWWMVVWCTQNAPRTAAVSRAASHITTKQRCKMHHSSGYSKTRHNNRITHSENIATKSVKESALGRRIAPYKGDRHLHWPWFMQRVCMYSGVL